MTRGRAPHLQPFSAAADPHRAPAAAGGSFVAGSNSSGSPSTGTDGRSSQTHSRMQDSKEFVSPSGGLLRAFGRERVTAVIKVGTSTLMDERAQIPSFSLAHIGKLVDTICLLRSKGVSVLLVTSGAVGAGCVSLHLKKRPEAVREKQALAAVGQCRLMRLYEDLFGVREVRVAQLLVSRNDFLRQRTYGNFRSCLRSLVDLNVVPILNENDSICTEELRFGDNDTLAAHCAVALEADFLFILTDVDCLYTQNPKLFTDARPVWFVDRFTDVYSYLSLQGGAWGTGGMYTKVVASKIATNLGVHVGIVNGAYPERVLDMLEFVAENVTPASPLYHDAPAGPPTLPGPPAPSVAVEPAAREIESESSLSSLGETPILGALPASAIDTGLPFEQLVIGQGAHPNPGVAFKQKPPSHPAFPISTTEGDDAGGAGSLAARPPVDVGTLELPPSLAAVSSVSGAPSPPPQPAETSSSPLTAGSPIFSALCGEAAGMAISSKREANGGADPLSLTNETIASPAEKRGSISELAQQFDLMGSRSSDSQPQPMIAAPGSTAPPTEGKEPSQTVGCPKRAHHHMRMQQQQQQQLDQLQQQQHNAGWPQQMRIRFSIPDEATREESPPPFIGTIFISQAPTGPSQSARLVRRWILALPVRGEVYVDVGCARSLVLHRKSLFAAGVKAVRGTFVAGECLSIFLHGYQSTSSVMSAEIGRCVSSFSSEELNIVKGHRSRDFERLLGYSADQEVAHRHDLVLVYMNGDDRLRRICEGMESL